MLVWELTLYNPVFQCVQCHPELIYQHLSKIPKAGPSRGTEEEGVFHGAINEEEATQHRQRLEEVFVAMEQKIKDEEEDALKEASIGCKATIK